MARNNKRINKYKTYFDLNRNVSESIMNKINEIEMLKKRKNQLQIILKV